MVFFQKWPFFDVFEIPLCWQRKKSQKMTQKWASIFFPVPRFFDFSSTEIFQKIPALEIFFKTRFLPVSIRTNAFFWFFIFFQCQDFFQKISSAGKSRHWKKMKKSFFARLHSYECIFLIFHFFPVPGFFPKNLQCREIPALEKNEKTVFCPSPKKVPIGFLSFYYFRLAFSKNPIGIPTGDLQYRNNLQYRNKRVLPVSPTGFFLLGRAHFYYLGSPPRGGRFTSRPTAYVGPALPALEVVRGPCVPIAIFCFS